MDGRRLPSTFVYMKNAKCVPMLAGWLGWLIELKCISSTCLFNYPRPPNYSTATTTTTTLTSSLGIEQNKNTLTNVTSLIYMRDV